MERLNLEQAEVEARSMEMLALIAQDVRADLLPEDRPDRFEIVVGSPLKLYDDVQTRDGRFRVIGAAIGRDRFLVYGYGGWGLMTTTVAARDVLDRAPLDPAEEPMPVWVEPEPPPPPPPPDPPQPDLSALRLETIKKVDVTSSALIRHGFVFEGILFSMSNEAQIRYTNMQMDAEYLPYPLPINSKDDLTFLVLRDAAHTVSFCRGAKAHVMSVVASGTLQKHIVRAMQTVEELIAYKDPRADALSEEQFTEAAQDMSAGRPAAS